MVTVLRVVAKCSIVARQQEVKQVLNCLAEGDLNLFFKTSKSNLNNVFIQKIWPILHYLLNDPRRKKFRYEKPERSETFVQFSSRLRSYLNKWINMAKIEESYEAICDFMARDQFLESCNRELYVHLKPKTFKNLNEIAKEADLFAEARGGVQTCVNRE